MIRIVVDAASDYSMEEAKEKHLDLVPIAITIEGNQYVEGENLNRDQFYRILAETGAFPQTSQPSPQDFLDIFLDAKEKGDEVLCILLSSGLSGTCQSAMLAKDMADYEKITVIDSLTATCNIRVLADYALWLAQEGHPAEKIAARIEAMKTKVKVVAALDTLEYLARGGRISRTAAVVGDLAGLKPLITLNEEGKVGVMGKALGKNKAIGQILKYLDGVEVDKDFPVYSIYSYGTENCEKFEEKLEAHGISVTRRLQIGATIGAHIGPEAFGLVFAVRG